MIKDSTVNILLLREAGKLHLYMKCKYWYVYFMKLHPELREISISPLFINEYAKISTLKLWPNVGGYLSHSFIYM